MSDDMHDDLRLQVRSFLANDLPAAYPGGPSHPAGTLVTMTSLVKMPDGRRLGFSTPSSAAMALNTSIRAAEKAEELRVELQFVKVASPDGIAETVQPLSLLFDFFEQSMIATTFAFQAIEAYCNYVIRFRLKGTISVHHKGRSQDMNASDLERWTTTSEKVASIVPRILAVSSPKGRKEWEGFQRLQRTRDATVHLKHADQTGIDENTLFYRFLTEQPIEHPRAAIALLAVLCTTPPQWLEPLREKAWR